MIIKKPIIDKIKKAGFLKISDDINQQIWLTPVSGRVLIIADGPTFYRYQSTPEFGGLLTRIGPVDEFLTALIGQLNAAEHYLIDLLLND